MTPTLSPTSHRARRSPRPGRGSSLRSDRELQGKHDLRHESRVLGRYVDRHGRSREVLSSQGSAASVLVLDRDVATRGDCRLVAHLAADEPAENAMLVCEQYLRDAQSDRCRCRRLTAEDARSTPLADLGETLPRCELTAVETAPVDSRGCSYQLELVQSTMSIPELRWCRRSPHSRREDREPVSLREVVASLESYEPMRALTLQALQRHGGDGDVSSTVLRMELERVLESPIVLNRKLREVVLATSERQALSMSEMALRCGRVKRDSNGNESGETSWLARRLGLLSEAGRDAPTPWIHSDVLALIARRGLGIAPREVELT